MVEVAFDPLNTFYYPSAIREVCLVSKAQGNLSDGVEETLYTIY